MRILYFFPPHGSKDTHIESLNGALARSQANMKARILMHLRQRRARRGSHSLPPMQGRIVVVAFRRRSLQNPPLTLQMAVPRPIVPLELEASPACPRLRGVLILHVHSLWTRRCRRLTLRRRRRRQHSRKRLRTWRGASWRGRQCRARRQRSGR